MHLKDSLLKLIKDHKTTLIVLVAAFFAYRLGANGGWMQKPYYTSHMRGVGDINYVGNTRDFAADYNKGVTFETGVDEAQISPASSSMMYKVESMLSMVVLDVNKAVLDIQEIAQNKAKGYLVTKDISNGEENSYGSITVRIPGENKDLFVKEVKSLGLRVVTETINVGDITDSYTNYEKQLEPLQKANEIFYGLLTTTTDVNEVLKVQQAITNTQKQIDRIEGQMRMLEKQSQTNLITIYVATNENTLPYIPNNGWSFKTVVKEAIRSLVISLQSITELAVKIAIFSVIWVPALGVFLFIRKLAENKKTVVKDSKNLKQQA
ncbi:DUF4349 domain-containing protein [Candidatus Nomurabacteria bacterium]|uniref:DUF4349 domain-containing protein n=1 Tax=candidate division WWE3 bacterium TaxID=2053526 RepID=A0A955E067_UNCKA|nr:DUF4349 domain-containing protein [candidate division WWE3 bacterium]MCB9823929.1 DUF4349 domain-containing protein [Candidatus Nomurabacteria bacterium]MCB9827090.1 DUF4349 domain-containing protein [Candidatus Nomurabacteria bacterium]MCB9827868.1 DUF4349 domain-containing protein [Candidatus Nomurabacteria bacterium]